MESILLKNISKHEDQSVQISGWIFNKRSSGSIAFLQIRDGTGFIQGVVSKKEIGEEVFSEIEQINLESSIQVEGIVHKDDRSPDGYELWIQKVSILCLSPENYPIQKKRDGSKHGISFLLDNRHLHLRDNRQWAIQRVRNTIIYSIYDFLQDNDFIKIDSPIFTPNACEGTTTLFEVPYTPAWEEGATSGLVAYLSQSGQLYLEAAVMSHRRVFDFGPVFRAEKSKTRRHLVEFWMMDAEMAFIDHTQNMKLQEQLTAHIVSQVLDKNQKELKLLERDTKPLEPAVKGEYKIIEHKEAVKIVQNLGSDMTENDDFGADDETLLTKQFDRPIFVEKYPKHVKAFYMKEDTNDSTRVLNADMLAPEGYGEVVGGSEREEDYDKLVARIKEAELKMEDFGWYLDLRKYGSVPHSGFGIGLERYVAWICGLKHIRETIPFPRLMKRVSP